MPRYRITNRITGERQEVEAPYAQDACNQLGWLIGNCHVELVREGPFSGSLERRIYFSAKNENTPGGEGCLTN